MRNNLLALSAIALAVAFLDGVASGQDGKKDSLEPVHWRTIFDGKSLDGWEHVGPGKMVLEDGMIRTEGGMGLLWYTREKLGDCVIRVVYKTGGQEANSGIYVRIAEKPKDPWYAVHHGYEVQISDTSDEFHGTGAIYSMSKSSGRPTKPTGEWNRMEVVCDGDSITTILNGYLVNAATKSSLTRGKLLFQSEGAEIFFRKIEVRPLMK